MLPWLIRDARPADAPTLGWIHVESWRTAYRGIVPQEVLDGLDPGKRGAQWVRWILESGPGRLLVAERFEDGALLGFAGVGEYRGNPDDERDALAGTGCGELHLLYVEPDSWGSGVATDLIAAADASLASLGFTTAALWVFEANGRARRFYERNGWHDDGTRVDLEIGGAAIPEARHVRQVPAPL